jgi:hypothetical protein
MIAAGIAQLKLPVFGIAPAITAICTPFFNSTILKLVVTSLVHVMAFVVPAVQVSPPLGDVTEIVAPKATLNPDRHKRNDNAARKSFVLVNVFILLQFSCEMVD